MNINMRKLISVSLTSIFILLFLSASQVSIASSSPVDVIIKGKHLTMDVEPILRENRIYIPIRDFAERLDLKVEWLGKQNTAKLSNSETTILITTGQSEVYVNNNKIKLNEKSFIEKGRMFIPLRSVAEVLSQSVEWDQRNKVAIVGKFTSEYFEEYGFSIIFPSSWDGEFEISKDKDALVISSKINEIESLASIHRYTNVEWKNLNYGLDIPVQYDILSQDLDSVFALLYTSDVSYNLENENSVKKYKEMSNDLKNKHFKFEILEEKNSIIAADKEKYKDEIEILNDILNNHVPKDIFNNNEILTYKKQVKDTNFIYLRNMKNKDEVEIKVELEFDNKRNVVSYYHLKNYLFDLKENKLSQSDALKLANKFVNDYVNKKVELIKIPDLYPSLYEEGKHETYGDEDGKYVMVIDLEHGFVEYFNSKQQIN